MQNVYKIKQKYIDKLVYKLQNSENPPNNVDLFILLFWLYAMGNMKVIVVHVVVVVVVVVVLKRNAISNWNYRLKSTQQIKMKTTAV